VERSGVAEAVERAQAGKKKVALPELLRIVEGILAEARVSDKAVDPPTEEATSAGSRKRRSEDGIGGVADDGRPSQRSRPSQPEEPTGQVAGGEDWLSQCQSALKVERVREKEKLDEKTQPELQQARSSSSGVPLPLYWKLELPEVSHVLAQKGLLPEKFTPVENPHATLLYMGGVGSEDQAAKKAGVSREQFKGMREALEGLDGQEFEVKMVRIVFEESVVSAVVSLPAFLPCINKVPHVTLGTRHGVPPRYANEVLEEMAAGRKEGLTVVELPAPRPLKGRVSLVYESAAGGDVDGA